MIKKITVLIFCIVLSFEALGADLINEVFLNLNEEYVVQMSNKDIALKGLMCLSKIDEDIVLKRTADKIFLYYKNKMVESFSMPINDESTKDWADFCKKIMKASTKYSPKTEVLDFELEDRFAAKVFEGLDGYSRYFGAFDDEEEKGPLKIRRHYASRIVDEFLLIRVLRLQKDTAERIKESVGECSKCKGLVLDLRGNGGGFLSEAIKIAGLFLDEGIIAYTQADEKSAPQYFSAEKGDILDGKPMAVLIDGSTASAAEILAAALSEQNRAVLIGTKTYGKGAVQDVEKIGSERAMSITTSFFYTPSGFNIDKKGLTPFICTGSSEDCSKEDRFDKEEDIERAVKYLKTGI